MKRKLEIEEQKAKELYKTASPEFKEMLIDTFGQEFFCENIMDRVKTFKDACTVVGVEPCEISSLSKTKDGTAYEGLKIIARALNQGWVPDWTNHNQYKYYPWFEYDNASSGFVFSRVSYDHFWSTFASLGSRFCFKSETLARYAGTQFLSIYNDLLLIK